MNKHFLTLAIAVGSLLFCSSGSIAPAASASPLWLGQSGTGNKPDCSPDASGKPKKDCDKISSERMSTKATAGAKTAGTSTSSSPPAVASTSSTTAAVASSSSTAAAAPASGAKSGTKKDADKVSEERMSTRGLKPPPKDSKPAPKPDADTPK